MRCFQLTFRIFHGGGSSHCAVLSFSKGAKLVPRFSEWQRPDEAPPTFGVRIFIRVSKMFALSLPSMFSENDSFVTDTMIGGKICLT